MTQISEKSNFWTTIPGIITALTGLITVIGTMTVATNAKTIWTCYNQGNSVGEVTIWWGHKQGDAEWACKNWISTCGNQGGCTATKISK